MAALSLASFWQMTTGLPTLCYSDHISDETVTALGHSVKDVLLEMNDDLDASHVVGHADFSPSRRFRAFSRCTRY